MDLLIYFLLLRKEKKKKVLLYYYNNYNNEIQFQFFVGLGVHIYLDKYSYIVCSGIVWISNSYVKNE